MNVKTIIAIILIAIGVIFAGIGGTDVLALTILAFPLAITGGLLIATDISKRRSAQNQAILVKNAREKAIANSALFFCVGSEGRILSVYEDRVSLITKPKLFVGNYSNGEKTIYYKDCVGLQFNPSPSSWQLGYLQFETSSNMTNNSSTYYNENTFIWYLKKSEVTNEIMQKIYNFVNEKVGIYKNAEHVVNISTTQSNADELKKYKDLLDAGIITQEEFAAKKKQLLGL